MSTTGLWEPHCPTQKVGKLCYYICTKESEFPVRDIRGGCTEPNYETKTYNWFSKCNDPSGIRAAVRDGLSHILFVTRYEGTKRGYDGRFIVGYYEMGWTAEIDACKARRIAIKAKSRCSDSELEPRTAIKAKSRCFVPIEHAYEITDERWQYINLRGKTTSLTNLRYATQRICRNLLDEIVQHLDKHNQVKKYLSEVEQLKQSVHH